MPSDTDEQIEARIKKAERALTQQDKEYGHDPKCSECKILIGLIAACRQLQREKKELAEDVKRISEELGQLDHDYRAACSAMERH